MDDNTATGSSTVGTTPDSISIAQTSSINQLRTASLSVQRLVKCHSQNSRPPFGNTLSTSFSSTSNPSIFSAVSSETPAANEATSSKSELHLPLAHHHHGSQRRSSHHYYHHNNTRQQRPSQGPPKRPIATAPFRRAQRRRSGFLNETFESGNAPSSFSSSADEKRSFVSAAPSSFKIPSTIQAAYGVSASHTTPITDVHPLVTASQMSNQTDRNSQRPTLDGDHGHTSSIKSESTTRKIKNGSFKASQLTEFQEPENWSLKIKGPPPAAPLLAKKGQHNRRNHRSEDSIVDVSSSSLESSSLQQTICKSNCSRSVDADKNISIFSSTAQSSSTLSQSQCNASQALSKLNLHHDPPSNGANFVESNQNSIGTNNLNHSNKSKRRKSEKKNRHRSKLFPEVPELLLTELSTLPQLSNKRKRVLSSHSLSSTTQPAEATPKLNSISCKRNESLNETNINKDITEHETAELKKGVSKDTLKDTSTTSPQKPKFSSSERQQHHGNKKKPKDSPESTITRVLSDVHATVAKSNENERNVVKALDIDHHYDEWRSDTNGLSGENSSNDNDSKCSNVECNLDRPKHEAKTNCHVPCLNALAPISPSEDCDDKISGRSSYSFTSRFGEQRYLNVNANGPSTASKSQQGFEKRSMDVREERVIPLNEVEDVPLLCQEKGHRNNESAGGHTVTPMTEELQQLKQQKFKDQDCDVTTCPQHSMRWFERCNLQTTAESSDDVRHSRVTSNPSIAVLDEELRMNFNLSSFLFATTPHLIRSKPVTALPKLEEENFFSAVGVVHQLGHLAAKQLLGRSQQPIPPVSGNQALHTVVGESSYENSNTIEKFTENGSLDEENNSDVSISANSSMRSSDVLLDDIYSDEWSLYSNMLGDNKNSDEDWLSRSDCDDDENSEEYLTEFKANYVPVHSSTITGAQNSRSPSEWLSRLGIERQSSLTGLLDGLGLTSHIFNAVTTSFPIAFHPMTSSALPHSDKGMLTQPPHKQSTKLRPQRASTTYTPTLTPHLVPCRQKPKTDVKIKPESNPNNHLQSPEQNPSSDKDRVSSSAATGLSKVHELPPLTQVEATPFRTNPTVTVPYSIPKSPTHLPSRPVAQFPPRWPPRLIYRLSSLWESLEEPSCVGVETPCVDLDDGTVGVVVFVPSLSALQLVAVKGFAESAKFAYFESKPPHVRRPLSVQLRRLAAGLEVPVTASQKKLILEATSDDLDKEESWMAIYWMPLQQKELSKAAPPAFLVFYSFAPTDDPIVVPAPTISRSPSLIPNSHLRPPLYEVMPKNRKKLSSVTASAIPAQCRTSTVSTASLPKTVPVFNIPNVSASSSVADPPSTLLYSSPPPSSQSTISALASSRLSGLINATPQLVRFGVLPHRLDIREWGVHSTTNITSSSSAAARNPLSSFSSSGQVDKTFSTLRRVNQTLEEWMECKKIVHPDFEFVRRRLKF